MSASSPLQTIWFHPGKTLRQVAHENPGYGLFVLPILAGLAMSPAEVLFFDETGFFTRGFVWSSLFAFGPLVEILQVFVGSWLLHLIGQRLGGRADAQSIQPIVAWSNAPIVLLFVIGWLLVLVEGVFDEELTVVLETAESWVLWLICGMLVLVELAAIALSLRILVAGLATVHGYSTLRAVQTILLAWLAAALAVIFVAVLLGLTSYLGRFFLGNLWSAT